ncbi:hypothetical protein [Shewanella algae]|uniref:hypothetical protein n=1 Tax=Shewanella algae TaxID=38313 RepID=UPI001C55AAD5|nr:hypothetical protein [Shewanella algae]
MKKIINYFLILSGAAFQGLQKLIIITLLFKLYGSEYAGQYAALVSIPTFVSLFCGMGFGSKLLKLIPNETIAKRKGIFNKITVSSMLWALFVSIFLFFINYTSIYNVSLSVLPYIFALSMILLIRHYYMAMLDYLRLFVFDFVSLLITVVLIFFSRDAEQYVLLSSLFLFVFVLFWYLINISRYETDLIYFYDKEVSQFSFNNVLSAGMLSLLPIILSELYGAAVTGEVMVLINFFSVFLLLSRSFASYNIPKLVSAIKLSNDNFLTSAEGFSYRYNVLTIIFMLLALFTTFAINYSSLSNYSEFEYTTLCAQLSVAIFVFSGSFGVVQGIYLFILKGQKYSIYSNLMYFALSILLFFVISLLDISISVTWMMSMLAVVSVLRYPYLKYYSSKFVLAIKEGVL